MFVIKKYLCGCELNLSNDNIKRCMFVMRGHLFRKVTKEKTQASVLLLA